MGKDDSKKRNAKPVIAKPEKKRGPRQNSSRQNANNEKPGKQVEPQEQPQEKPLQMVFVVAVLALALTISCLIMTHSMGNAFDGYHSVNEAFYTDLGAKYSQMSFYEVLIKPIDTNNPPLFPMLLAILFKIFGVNEAVARVIPILFTLLSIVLTYCIGRLLFNDRVGLIASFVLAVSPGFLLVGRNVQTEAVYVFFILASVYYFFDSLNKESLKRAFLAGVFLGLAILTKIVSVLLLVALVIWFVVQKRRISWPDKSLVYYSVPAIILGFGWHVLQLISNSGKYISSQSYLAGTIRLPNLPFILFLAKEVFWALSPLVFVLLIVAAAYALTGLIKKSDNKSSGTLFAVIFIGVFAIFFMFYNFHSYYIIPAVPMVALLISAGLFEALKNRKVVLQGILITTIATSLLFAVLLLGTQKYGFDRVPQITNFIQQRGENPIALEISDKENLASVLKFYLPGIEHRNDSFSDFPKDKYVFWVPHEPADVNQFLSFRGEEDAFMLNKTRVGPVVFGIKMSVNNPNLNYNYFALDNIAIERSDDIFFGLSEKDEAGGSIFAVGRLDSINGASTP